MLHDVAPSEMDDVTWDIGISDERASWELFVSYSGLSSQTLSDTTEEEEHVETRKHIAHYQTHSSKRFKMPLLLHAVYKTQQSKVSLK